MKLHHLRQFSSRMQRFISKINTNSVEYKANYTNNIALVQKLQERMRSWTNQGADRMIKKVMFRCTNVTDGFYLGSSSEKIARAWPSSTFAWRRFILPWNWIALRLGSKWKTGGKSASRRDRPRMWCRVRHTLQYPHNWWRCYEFNNWENLEALLGHFSRKPITFYPIIGVVRSRSFPGLRCFPRISKCVQRNGEAFCTSGVLI